MLEILRPAVPKSGNKLCDRLRLPGQKDDEGDDEDEDGEDGEGGGGGGDDDEDEDGEVGPEVGIRKWHY